MWSRVERFMLETGKTWAQTAQVLGCSTAAMSQWKSGKTSLSRRSLYRLSCAERAAGLAAADLGGLAALRETSEVRKSASGARPASSEVRKSGLRRELAALKAQVARLEKLIEEDAP